VLGLLEIKCPETLQSNDVNKFEKVLTKNQINRFCLMRGPEGIKLKTSHAYYYQVQMQMGITGLKWCDFVVWAKEGYIVDRITFDPSFWSDVQSKLIKFHHDKLCPEVFEMKTPRNLSHVIL
jgi:hypothetical protein